MALAVALGSEGMTWIRTTGVVVTWLVLTYGVGVPGVRFGVRGLRQLVGGGARTAAGVALVGGVLAWGPAVNRAGLEVVAAATLAALAARAAWMPLRRLRRVVLVGERALVEAAAAQLASAADVRVCGVCVIGSSPIPFQGPLPVPTVRKLTSVADLVQRVDADSVLMVPSPTLSAENVRRLAWSLEPSRVSLGVVWSYDWMAAHRLDVGVLGTATVLGLRAPRSSTLGRTVKVVFDRIIAALLLALLAPLIAAMWVAVKLESRGPGFFVQTRVGLHGRTFRMYKMRTMCVDAEDRLAELRDRNDVDATLFKLRSDPRVTRLGRFLRRTSLDELPQLWNVLCGSMSLVGPRPALPAEVATYDDLARRRLAVRPGITGLWQVSGRSDLSWEESVRLDLHYTDNWRLVDDLVIAARTVRAVTRARGAY